MNKALPKNFYQNNTVFVAQGLVGKILVRKYRGRRLSGMIVETEAYRGFKDKACHAARGKTTRNRVMFGEAGRTYIYMIYGMYFCLNIVTEEKNYPAAVLIRALEPQENMRLMARNRKLKRFNPKKIASGPGKLCQALKIDKKLNGIALKNDQLWIEDRGEKMPKHKIIEAERVGIDYAGASKKLKWRFYLKDSEYISQK